MLLLMLSKTSRTHPHKTPPRDPSEIHLKIHPQSDGIGSTCLFTGGYHMRAVAARLKPAPANLLLEAESRTLVRDKTSPPPAPLAHHPPLLLVILPPQQAQQDTIIGTTTATSLFLLW